MFRLIPHNLSAREGSQFYIKNNLWYFFDEFFKPEEGKFNRRDKRMKESAKLSESDFKLLNKLGLDARERLMVEKHLIENEEGAPLAKLNPVVEFLVKMIIPTVILVFITEHFVSWIGEPMLNIFQFLMWIVALITLLTVAVAFAGSLIVSRDNVSEDDKKTTLLNRKTLTCLEEMSGFKKSRIFMVRLLVISSTVSQGFFFLAFFLIFSYTVGWLSKESIKKSTREYIGTLVEREFGSSPGEGEKLVPGTVVS